MKRIVTIQDISCVGKCSLTVALPIISATGVEAAIIPTAVLSTHTMFKNFTCKDLDDQILPILSLGGKGVISVLSNLLPGETSAMCKKYFRGDTAGATADQLRYLDLINALFCEVNPIPAKAAMAALGRCENSVRLPLTTIEPEHGEMLLSVMRKHGLI